MATLIVTADTKGSREILRVENTQKDTRIESAICQQFGAKSLLILLNLADLSRPRRPQLDLRLWQQAVPPLTSLTLRLGREL